MSEIFVDGDACPVKQEIYRVAERYEFHVTVVANSPMRIPQAAWLKLVVVEGRFDAADDWIVERATDQDIVITADIPLAARSLKKGAVVLDMRGNAFSEATIGSALASRELMSHLRDLGTINSGPAPFDKRDRSRFLQRLDEAIQTRRRKKKAP